MRRVLSIIQAAVISLGATSESSAQRVVKGSVVASSGVVVPYANVEQGARRVIADDSGRFSITVPAGAVTLHVRRIGFQPANQELDAGGDTSIVVVLPHLAQQLPRAIVEARQSVRSLELHGFYKRLHEREKGISAGQFITAEEIERRNPNRITQMLEGRSGVRVKRVCPWGLSANDPRCWAPAGPNGCFMTVYLDGKRLTSLLGRPGDATAVDEVVMPSHVAGIEIYTTAGKVPPEYQLLNGMCGVILLWSK
jgi:hypothetical protein